MVLVKKGITLLHKIPHNIRKRLLLLMVLLVFVNVLVWLLGLYVSRFDATILGLIILAYGFGLRHAVDADHIAAIDNTTRKLVNERKTPVAVGLFFSLGHSTIVILLSLLIAIASSYVKHAIPALQTVGFLIGTTVSSVFLFIIGFINLIAFIKILQTVKQVRKGENYDKKIGNLTVVGPMQKVFNTLLRSVTASWQMYFIGFLFGLGFDTATEVGLLSLTAITSATGASFWTILLLPFAFTASMSLIDTLDGVLMLGAYGWAYIKPARKLYYNLNITLVSVLVALGIGTMQILTLVSSAFALHNRFFRMVTAVNIEDLGFGIIALFLLTWIISFGIYKCNNYDSLL